VRLNRLGGSRNIASSPADPNMDQLAGFVTDSNLSLL